MMIAGGFTCQRYGFNVGADKFSLLTIENGKTSIMRLSEWTLISQSQKSHSDRLLGERRISVCFSYYSFQNTALLPVFYGIHFRQSIPEVLKDYGKFGIFLHLLVTPTVRHPLSL